MIVLSILRQFVHNRDNNNRRQDQDTKRGSKGNEDCQLAAIAWAKFFGLFFRSRGDTKFW